MKRAGRGERRTVDGTDKDDETGKIGEAVKVGKIVKIKSLRLAKSAKSARNANKKGRGDGKSGALFYFNVATLNRVKPRRV